MDKNKRVERAIALLNLHYDQFTGALPHATETKHPVPSDTRGWSQILVSELFGKKGRGRKKGSDIEDGSDVKAANIWNAIDTPRFNGVLKAGTNSSTSGKLESLDATPYLFFVLWDNVGGVAANAFRCRIWFVRPPEDILFREMAKTWFGATSSGNFQLHPPRKLTSETNIIRNRMGTFEYPLYFQAIRNTGATSYEPITCNDEILLNGVVKPATPSQQKLAEAEALEEEKEDE